MNYKIKIDIEALADINEAYLWYEEQSQNLGERYKQDVINEISGLKSNPFIYAIRYDNVYCMKIKKFPFMVHFTVEDALINVFAVVHTSRNPKIWQKGSSNK